MFRRPRLTRCDRCKKRRLRCVKPNDDRHGDRCWLCVYEKIECVTSGSSIVEPSTKAKEKERGKIREGRKSGSSSPPSSSSSSNSSHTVPHLSSSFSLPSSHLSRTFKFTLIRFGYRSLLGSYPQPQTSARPSWASIPFEFIERYERGGYDDSSPLLGKFGKQWSYLFLFHGLIAAPPTSLSSGTSRTSSLTALSANVVSILPSGDSQSDLSIEGFSVLALLSQIAPQQRGREMMEKWAGRVRSGWLEMNGYERKKEGIGGYRQWERGNDEKEQTWKTMVRFFNERLPRYAFPLPFSSPPLTISDSLLLTVSSSKFLASHAISPIIAHASLSPSNLSQIDVPNLSSLPEYEEVIITSDNSLCRLLSIAGHFCFTNPCRKTFVTTLLALLGAAQSQKRRRKELFSVDVIEVMSHCNYLGPNPSPHKQRFTRWGGENLDVTVNEIYRWWRFVFGVARLEDEWIRKFGCDYGQGHVYHWQKDYGTEDDWSEVRKLGGILRRILEEEIRRYSKVLETWMRKNGETSYIKYLLVHLRWLPGGVEWLGKYLDGEETGWRRFLSEQERIKRQRIVSPIIHAISAMLQMGAFEISDFEDFFANYFNRIPSPPIAYQTSLIEKGHPFPDFCLGDALEFSEGVERELKELRSEIGLSDKTK